MFKRVFLIVMDSLGVGEAKDAGKFGDLGSNTLGHIIDEDYKLSVFSKLGLLSLIDSNIKYSVGYHTIMKPMNKAKDTLNGHYEMMGTILDKPFMTYPNGFPTVLISEIQRVTGRGVIGNCVASGTEIIKELGEEHIKTGNIIIYTSADSVLQVAAHDSVVPLEELYDICEKISKLVFNEEYKIGRVIARPFTGKVGDYTRTAYRKDFTSIPPYNYLDNLYEKDFDVIALGKIKDIFANKGITTGLKTKNNIDGLMKLNDFARTDFNGLLFLNLNDFDSLYGHRRDKKGYLNALEELDMYLPIFLNKLREDDLVIFTADHGNDPTYVGTDHTRENVPLLVYSKSFKYKGTLPVRNTFADIGATIIDNFGIENKVKVGTSFLEYLK